MERVEGHAHLAGTDGPKGPSGLLYRWSLLAACIFIVWLFIFVLAPALQTSPMVKPLADYISESGIEAGALYYTEVEETSEAEVYLRNALKKE